MAPIIEVSDSVLKGLDQLKIPYNFRKESLGKPDSDNFLYVPSLNLYVAKERSLYGKDWFEAHEGLQSRGNRMITVPEFVQFLKYTKENEREIYREVIGESSWGAEWLDAKFKFIRGKLSINSKHVYKKGRLVPKNSELLDKGTSMTDPLTQSRDYGISLEGWLADGGHTKQGLPTKEVESPGNLGYWFPRGDRVAGFSTLSRGGTCLGCGGDPEYRDINFGVRAVRGSIPLARLY